MLIDLEQAYPQFETSVRVQVDGKPPAGWDHAVVEGQPDRMWTVIYRMNRLAYREMPTVAQVYADTEKFWEHAKKETTPTGGMQYPNPTDVELKIGEVQWETWVPGWFSHWTFDDGRTDAEFNDSFMRYVHRNRGQSHLMGADEIYRWSNPCRCDKCKALGFVRIDH